MNEVILGSLTTLILYYKGMLKIVPTIHKDQSIKVTTCSANLH